MAWSELGLSPPERLGFGLYVFNPDVSADRFAILLLAAEF